LGQVKGYLEFISEGGIWKDYKIITRNLSRIGIAGQKEFYVIYKQVVASTIGTYQGNAKIAPANKSTQIYKFSPPIGCLLGEPFNIHQHRITGKKNWLVSPIVDFSQLLEASLFFKVSYASNPNSIDTLEVIVLEDCGETEAGLLYQKSGEELGDTVLVDIEWIPQQTSDWRTEFLDLSGLIGRRDLRIALISTDGGGNNLFIDDIEFFLSSDPNPAEVPDNNFIIFPNPTQTNEFKVSFNLPQKEDLTLLLYSPTGHIISTVELPNTLNQTYTYDFLNQPNGIYFLRIVGKSFVKTKRVGINQ